jgi:hypothetical protein
MKIKHGDKNPGKLRIRNHLGPTLERTELE